MTAPTTGRFEAVRASLLDRSLCPACGAPLTGPRCMWCGVPLDGPAAQAVLRLSVAAADALTNREVALRALYQERDARLPRTTSDAAHPAPTSGAARVRPPGSPTPRTAPPSARPGTTSRAPLPQDRRPPARPRWRVQSVLQALGAGLLSAAGIVFLVFSWGVLNLELRAAVIALGTVVVFVAAQVLARRGLRQGAEAVGAVAAVLLLLDAWALRRTGVVGSGTPGVYASTASVVCAALLAGWGRTARLRVGTVGAALLWFVAPLPLATLDPSPRTWTWALLGSVAMSWVRHLRAVRASDDDATALAGVVLFVGAGFAWPTAALLGLVTLSTEADAGLGLLSALFVVAALQALLCLRAPRATDEAWALAWQVGAVSAALVGILSGAVLARPATGSALMLVAAGAGSALVAATARDTQVLAPPQVARGLSGTGRAIVSRPPVTLIPAAALLITVGTGALVPGGALSVVLLMLLTMGAALVDRRSGDALGVGARTIAARITVVAAPLVALLAGHGAGWWTAVGLGACAVVAAWGRTWGVLRSWAAWSTAAAAPWTVAAIGTAAHAAGASIPGAIAIATSAGAALLSLVVVLPDRPRDERQVALAAAAASAALGWALLAVVPGWWDRSALLPVVAACGLVVLALQAGEDHVGRLGAVVSAGATAPVLALAALSAAVVVRPAHAAVDVVLVAAGVGAGAVLLSVVAKERRSESAGAAAATGGWTTLLAALLAAVQQSAQLVALVLLVGAVTALVTGVRDGRAELRWGALALATAASWTLLAAGGQGTPELFTAPTAVVVAAVGARRVRRGRADGVTLLGAGLSLTFLPTALLSGAVVLGPGLQVGRWLLTTAAAVVLTFLAARRAHRPDAWVTTVLAALGLCLSILGPAREAVVVAGRGDSGALPELFGLLGAVLLLVCCRSVDAADRTPVAAVVRAAEPWLVTVTVVVPSVLAAAPGSPGRIRVSALVLIGAAVALVGAARDSRQHDGWSRHLMGVGVLVASAGALVAIRTLPAAPVGVVPAALGLLVVATLFLRPPRWSAPADQARSLYAVLLLVPILLARNEAWRPAAWTGIAAALLVATWFVRARAAHATTVRVIGALAGGFALVGPWWHAVAPHLDAEGAMVGAPERWAVPAAALVAAATVLVWPRRSGTPTLLTLTAPALAVAVLPTLLVADATPVGSARLGAVLLSGSALAVVAQLRRFGAVPAAVARDARWAVGAGVIVAGAAVLTATVVGPWASDVPILVYGIVLTALGLLRTTADASARSWPALGPGLLLTVVVPAFVTAADAATWRPVVVVLLAVAATVLGAVLRWQAPFLVGAGTLVLVTGLELGPWAGRVLVQVQGWVLLALCGTLLLALGLRYERRLAQAREAVRFVATMR